MIRLGPFRIGRDGIREVGWLVFIGGPSAMRGTGLGFGLVIGRYRFECEWCAKGYEELLGGGA